MAGYRLSERADEDYESIYLYGALTFGLEHRIDDDEVLIVRILHNQDVGTALWEENGQ